MTDLIVTSVSAGGSGGRGQADGEHHVDFAKFKFSYTPQKADGTADSPVSMGWDIVRNMPA